MLSVLYTLIKRLSAIHFHKNKDIVTQDNL